MPKDRKGCNERNRALNGKEISGEILPINEVIHLPYTGNP